MARDPKPITVSSEATLEFITIKDKDKPQFRAKRPDEYYVRIIIKLPRVKKIVHESVFLDKGKAQTFYDDLKLDFSK